MTELIVDELLDEVALEQDFNVLNACSIERVRLHLAFINIDKTSNPGTLTLSILDGATTIAEKSQTFAEIKAAGGITFGTALDSTSQQWHGYVSFVFDAPVNIRAGAYSMELLGDYTFVSDTNWVGWVKEHDNFKYPTPDGYEFPDDILQDAVPHSYEMWTWQKIADF